MNKRKFWAISAICLLLFSIVKSQSLSSDLTGKVTVTPPSAAAFTQYGKCPVSLFTGIPDIKVPLYNIKVDNVEVPVYLSYYARGIQPNNHAGWVGTGWNLFAGSAITRKVNSAPDESVCSGSGILNTLSGQSKNYHDGDQLGWYWKYSKLNRTDWATEAALNSYVPLFPFQGSVAPIVEDSAPDEFNFNINGISGAFFLGEDGLWKIRSNAGENIKIKEATVGSYQFNEPNCSTNNVSSTFTKFILLTSDGTQYIFGNTTSSIEFNKTGPRYDRDINNLAISWQLTKIVLPSGKIIQFFYSRRGVQYTYNPSSHVGVNTVTVSTTPASSFPFLDLSGTDGYAYTAEQYMTDFNVNIVDPVFLDYIEFPQGKLVFNSIASGETDLLESPYSSTLTVNNSSTSAQTNPGSIAVYGIVNSYYNQIVPSGTGLVNGRFPSNWIKLQSIELYDADQNKLKTVSFTYTSDANTRLFLNSVKTTGYYGNSNGVEMPPYVFTYNTTQLPPYCSRQIDHWGYYNGTPSVNPIPAYNNTTGFQTSYMNFRKPNAFYIQAGILTRIDYPTGGFTSFTYEANTFKKHAGSIPLSSTSVTLSAEEAGAGLRIKQILSQPDANSPQAAYQYYYVNDLTSNVSSGVLGMPIPSMLNYFSLTPSLKLYSTAGYSSVDYVTFSNSSFSSTSIVPNHNDDGNIVTYSKVYEKQLLDANNGVKITTFSNHDNGYANNFPDSYYWIDVNNQIKLGEYSDRSFERGLVLSEEYYDNAVIPNLVKKIVNTYNDDPARLNNYVKSVMTGQTTIGASSTQLITLPRISAVRNYIYYPFLKQSVETDYPSDHSSNIITKTTSYTYDANNRNLIKKVELNSKGEQNITYSRYAPDFNVGTGTTTDNFVLGVKYLQTNGISSSPVEIYSQKANTDGTNLRTIDATLLYYSSFFPIPLKVDASEKISPLASFTPAAINSAILTKDPTYKAKHFVDNLDLAGNILQMHKANDINISYEWGYKNEYPIVEIKNAENSLHDETTTTNATQTENVSYSPPNPSYSLQTRNFTIDYSGTVTFNLYFGSPPGTGGIGMVSYYLTGPQNKVGTLCATGNCGSYVSTISFSNMPAGNYTLELQLENFTSQNGILYFYYSYPKILTTVTSVGIKEFFFESFEENTSSSAVAGTSHSGKKYWNTSYTTNFTKPNSRNYVIQWWNLSGGKWIFNEQPFTTNVTLTGPIDDVRIFPNDALMTSYTYEPLIGMTSQTDAVGKSITYEYDSFGRLKTIRDQDNNVLKTMDYQYQQPNNQ
ncbi:hypothetical protein DC498_25630 [Terrimonas sp.]|uniref:RHS repeat domain-containing protein n=1 Tax=Terrimonas sp. TaxID=1914338 RepID=UPI000D5155C7|nr:RHS repeat domain-containing protein [Terrimonas sp.]PVD49321.1 hypothetical protein DC498_25630 [Terrimonas sp.]